MIKDIFLLVGGEATRLKPLSEGIPKALLTIKGRLLIDLILENLEESNFNNINLICSIKHESYWIDYKKNSKYKVNLHFEHEKLDTGGYVVKNIESFDEKFLCMNGDLIIDMNFESFLEVANNSKNSTICSISVEDPSRYGVLELEGTKILNFIEKPKDMKYGNNISLGVYCFHKEDIKAIKNNLKIPCSFEKDVFLELAKNNLLDCYSIDGKMLDVGTRESYIYAHTENQANWISQSATIGKDTVIKNSVILGSSFIGNNVQINNSVICNEATVEDEAVINDEIFKS
tara:strand:+ start:34 stop:897 length:864 start_codon:yes stop_codon:yes gene_type:complete